MKSTSNLSLSGLALAVSVLLSPVMADEVSDSIKEATTAYESGDINATVENLNYAVQLLQQMKGQQLSELLPDALDGWTAEESESTAVGAAMFGGGLTAERKYRKDKKSRVTIQIVTDSPLLQSMMVMFSNPMFASSSGGKMTKVSGHKAIATYKESRQRGEYKLMINNRYMVTVEGQKVTQDELKAYVEAIDFEKFEK